MLNRHLRPVTAIVNSGGLETSPLPNHTLKPTHAPCLSAPCSVYVCLFFIGLSDSLTFLCFCSILSLVMEREPATQAELIILSRIRSLQTGWEQGEKRLLNTHCSWLVSIQIKEHCNGSVISLLSFIQVFYCRSLGFSTASKAEKLSRTFKGFKCALRATKEIIA